MKGQSSSTCFKAPGARLEVLAVTTWGHFAGLASDTGAFVGDSKADALVDGAGLRVAERWWLNFSSWWLASCLAFSPPPS